KALQLFMYKTLLPVSAVKKNDVLGQSHIETLSKKIWLALVKSILIPFLIVFEHNTQIFFMLKFVCEFPLNSIQLSLNPSNLNTVIPLSVPNCLLYPTPYMSFINVIFPL